MTTIIPRLLEMFPHAHTFLTVALLAFLLVLVANILDWMFVVL